MWTALCLVDWLMAHRERSGSGTRTRTRTRIYLEIKSQCPHHIGRSYSAPSWIFHFLSLSLSFPILSSPLITKYEIQRGTGNKPLYCVVVPRQIRNVNPSLVYTWALNCMWEHSWFIHKEEWWQKGDQFSPMDTIYKKILNLSIHQRNVKQLLLRALRTFSGRRS